MSDMNEVLKRLDELHASTTKGMWASPTANVFRILAWDGNIPTRVIVDEACPEKTSWGNVEVGWGDPADFTNEECDKLGKEAAANMEFIVAAHGRWPDIRQHIRDVEAKRDAWKAYATGNDRLADSRSYAEDAAASAQIADAKTKLTALGEIA